ncbi:restriction endonuclease subunit S [Streptomyces kebangsaanensis]|uniref:Restriction endonuclease subunit S n=1 Tax=Streptomyces kebangsaanensis TaxID=864058 RepID=A0ABW6KS33_9ACTN
MEMDGLPDSWSWVSLKDVLSEPLINGRSVKTMEGGFPVLRLTAIADGKIDLGESKEGAWSAEQAEPFLVWRGDFLLSRGNGSKRLVGRGGLVGNVGSPVAFPDTMIRVRLSSKLVSSSYFRLLWDSPVVRRQIEAKARTTAGIYKVNQAILEGVALPLPPLAEQRRIVEALEEQLSRLDAAEVNVRKVTRRIDVLLGRVTDFTADIAVGADEPAAPFPEEAGSIDGQLPRIPANWRWTRLGELADVVGGVTKDKKKQSDPDLPEVPYLRVANVQRGRLDLENVATIRVPPKKAEQLRLKVGDVLMNEGGDRDKLGRGWVWRGEVSDAIHQNHVFRARIRQGLLMPELLSWYANGAAKWFEENGKQSTNLASISLSKIKNLPVPVPPETEQGRIAERIEERLVQLRHARVAAERVLRQGGKLRNALLRKAFEGNLVPQDKADEPAAAVLARIAAERATQPKPKRTRKATAKMPIPRAAEATTPAPEPTPAPALAVQQEIEL